MPVIYKIYIKAKNAVYIGQTNYPERRWVQHKNDLVKGVHVNYPLLNLYQIVGLDALAFEILLTAPTNLSALQTQRWLGRNEINQIASHRDDGYQVLNISAGEVVTTKAAWDLYVEECVRKERERLKLLPKVRDAQTFKRRELLVVVANLDRLAKLTLWLKNEREIVTLEGLLVPAGAVKSFFGYKKSLNELNSIRTRLNELKEEKTKANSERVALIKMLRDSGVEIDANLSWDAIHEKMRTLKRKAHHLRNRSKDLKFNPRIEGEIPLDDGY